MNTVPSLLKSLRLDKRGASREKSGEYDVITGSINEGGLFIGIDPGLNFGLTVISNGKVEITYGKLPSNKMPGISASMAFDFIRKRFSRMFLYVAVVEGASYGDPYGQPRLAEIRTGFYLGLIETGCTAYIMPPKKIRKLALGSGTSRVGDYFPLMNDNAADSLGCALAAMECLGEIHRKELESENYEK